MPSQIYRDLRQQLDQYSVGFPETESGVEYRILERLFDEVEARTYLSLSLMSEPAEAIAAKLGEDLEAVLPRLATMVDKGLIFRVSKGGTVKYGAAAFMVGTFEYQVESLDRELAALFEQYFLEAFGKGSVSATPVLRTIPVNQAIEVIHTVAPYDDARQIVRSKDRIAVAKCICRVQQGLLGAGCGKPLEVCLTFGSHAQYYVDKGLGRWITTEQALQILDECDAAGLVPQPFNARNPGGICCCCGDCCGALRALKLLDKPADKILTSYYATVDGDLCTACEECIDRCPMDAITVAEGADAVAVVERSRCIGCGLCTTTCSSGAATLVLKPAPEQHVPPATAYETLMQLAAARGKTLVPLSLISKPEP